MDFFESKSSVVPRNKAVNADPLAILDSTALDDRCPRLQSVFGLHLCTVNTFTNHK